MKVDIKNNKRIRRQILIGVGVVFIFHTIEPLILRA